MRSSQSIKTESIQNVSLPSIPREAVNNNKESNEYKFKFLNGEKVQLPKLQSREIKFFHLVADNDIDGLKRYLEEHSRLNINCTNFQGISALHIAVRNRSEDMVDFLLKQPRIDIGDTVLHAVRDNNIRISEMLLEAQKTISPGLEFAGSSHSTEFPEYITPLLLAAHCGHFEMIQLLTSRGHTIVKPHPTKCLCISCKSILMNEDHLFASMTRLSIYRAISSPAYIVQTSTDPILTALHLASELLDNAAVNKQLAAAYLLIRDDVSTFAVDLIGCCRTSEEVELVLKQNTGCRGQRHFVLPRLLMAVNYKQKEFVAHPNTQQVLESYWSGGWYRWKHKSSLAKGLIVLSRVFVTPIIVLMCLVLPRHRLVKHWQIPLNKLITHTSAYIVFLALVFYVSNQDKTDQRGPPDTGAEAPLILYVCGYTWSALRMCLMQGPHKYFTDLWNWVEIMMLALFGLTFMLWVAAAVDVPTTQELLERKYWHQHDPTLLAEGTFCLATIFAYFRLMFLCQLNYHLGPLQMSLGKMAIDIYKYIIVFAIIISAFAAGLSRFYQYYDGMVYEDDYGVKTVQVSSFTSLSDTLKTLFWGLFCMAPLESAEVVLANTGNSKNPNKFQENRHGYTELIGYFCFGCFEVISVIVVLNMLIATMSNTFQKVNDNVAIEWTFGRTEVYINFMLQTTLPPPFNLVPTASGLSNMVDWLRARIIRPSGVYARWSPYYCCYVERDLDLCLQKEFPALMSVLVQRYFTSKRTSVNHEA